MQPPTNNSKCSNMVIGPSQRCDHIKIEPEKLKIKHLNDKIVQNGETTWNICIGSLDPGVDVIESRLNLKGSTSSISTSKRCKKTKQLTWDMPTLHSHP